MIGVRGGALGKGEWWEETRGWYRLQAVENPQNATKNRWLLLLFNRKITYINVSLIKSFHKRKNLRLFVRSRH
jgi:hypothetical protein